MYQNIAVTKNQLHGDDEYKKIKYLLFSFLLLNISLHLSYIIYINNIFNIKKKIQTHQFTHS